MPNLFVLRLSIVKKGGQFRDHFNKLYLKGWAELKIFRKTFKVRKNGLQYSSRALGGD